MRLYDNTNNIELVSLAHSSTLLALCSLLRDETNSTLARLSFFSHSVLCACTPLVVSVAINVFVKIIVKFKVIMFMLPALPVPVLSNILTITS